MEILKAKNWEKIYLTNTNKTTMKCFKTNINTLREIRKMSQNRDKMLSLKLENKESSFYGKGKKNNFVAGKPDTLPQTNNQD